MDDKLINITTQVSEKALLATIHEDAILERAEEIREKRINDREYIKAEIKHLTRSVKINRG